MSLPPDAERALAALLDVIVPPSGDGRMPGAGALGVGGFVEQALAGQAALRPVLLEGLALLDARAGERAGRAFAELERPARRAVLDAVAEQLPAFLGPLILLTYLGYYRQPPVLEALGLEPRPPYPKGYAVPPSDFALLDPVRRKDPFYREP